MRWLRRRLLYAHVTVLATLVPDLCRCLPLARLLRLFTPRPGRNWYGGLTAKEIVAAVNWRLRRPWRMRGRRCLREGLLALHFLRLAGLPAVLNFAVYRQSAAREQAHCWVTIDGQPLTEPPQAQHVLLLVHGEGQPREPRVAA